LVCRVLKHFLHNILIAWDGFEGRSSGSVEVDGVHGFKRCENSDMDAKRLQLKGARPCTYSHRIPYESAKGGIYLILPSLTRQTTLASLDIAASAENVRLKLVDVTETHPNP
jgi:hypothetical protein